MKRETRRVNNDATITLLGKLFEVSPSLIGQRIEVRFEPRILDTVLIYSDDEFLGEAKPVNLADNARIKRERYNQSVTDLSFHEALRKEER
ncbi:MAG: Mu transposase C-terminal domain-containing protein [Bacillota bacterium]